MIDLFSVEFSSLNNEQSYSAIATFAQAQPSESNRHDFKLIWNNDAIKDVAAFANTFGGILIVGVEKNQNDIEARVVGVQTNSELTTGIASSIATNISPTPSYDILECHKTGESNRRFCVVRVRADARLHLVTKKDISPACVRNADQTVRADASQLRGLIDRERQSFANASELLLHRRAQDLLDDMPIGKNHAVWPTGHWDASEAYFKLALIPTERKTLPLDYLDERRFVDLVHRNYYRVPSTLNGPGSKAESRSADYYEYRWYHKNLDYEGRWRITNNLEVAHSTQIMEDNQWSIMDVVSYAVLLLKIGGLWWRSLNYYGDGVLFAELAVGNLPVQQGRTGVFSGLFNPGGGSFGIGPDAVIVHPEQRPEAKADVGVNFSTMHADLHRTVTALMNALLRSLGHSVILTEFEDSMRKILA